ncbi:T9SS type A sorting domain-containing protein [candidate division KSB1 bacterium]
MYLEATLNNMIAPNNSSPIFFNSPIFMLCTNQTTKYNHNAYDPDGDSLSWEFTTPGNGSTSNVIYSPGYTANQPFISNPPVSIDSVTGEIKMSPITNLITVTAVKVTQWKNINGVPTIIGTVRRDMQLVSFLCNNNIPELAGINPAATGYNPLDTIYTTNASATLPISFNIFAYDPNMQNLILIADNDTLIPNSSFSVLNNYSTNPIGTFSWIPDTSDIYSNPHCFHVIVSDNNCPYLGYQIYTYCITVIPSVLGINEVNELTDFQVYPNPAKEEISLIINTEVGSYYILQIFNELGQAIFMEEFSIETIPYNKDFNVKELPKGVYYLKLSKGDLQRVKKVLLF